MRMVVKYSSLSTFDLIEQIVTNHDQSLLNYFISNRKLLSYNSKRVVLPDYLYGLRNRKFYPFISISQYEKHLDLKLDLTYDRTLKKFTELSNTENENGPYCNKQYESLLRQLKGYKNDNPNALELELESECEKRFHKMIIRHLSYSWLEVCRSSNRLYQRYRWELATGTIELKKPLHIDGRSFNKWLTEHVDNPNPKEKGEKTRIQKIIDDWFGVLAEINSSEIDYKLKNKSDTYFEVEKYPKDFTTMIASEKASDIDQLRPSIRKMGKETIYKLVKRILENIQLEELKDAKIQKEFGLSKATYSRFAGREWKTNNSAVPDLWKNIAMMVTKDPIISEHAESIGVSENISKLLEKKEE